MAKLEHEWNERDRTDNYVYIMAHVGATHLCGPTKIGISRNPVVRLGQIRYDEGRDDIIIVAQFAFWKRKHARWVEAAFHKVCDVYRVRGEWFDLMPADAVAIMKKNLKAFQQYLGADEVPDILFMNDYFSVPGAIDDIDTERFRETYAREVVS
jgi:hypothetical protein